MRRHANYRLARGQQRVLKAALMHLAHRVS
jgi:hypothetical protein